MVRSRLFWITLASMAAASCLLVRDLDSLEGAAPGDDATAPGVEGGGSSGASSSSSGQLPSDGGLEADAADAGSTCPEGRGPAMVRLPAPLDFCIDSTEVTLGQYRTFLQAGVAPADQPPRCASNGSFGSNISFPMPEAGRDQEPIRGVDFCDALAFCTWAGKTLCGDRETGGPTGLDAGPKGRWYAACNHNDDTLHDYPYGEPFDVNACNGLQRWQEQDAAAKLLPVASLPSCEGSYPGLFDLSGNVQEWEDSCATTDAGTRCVTRGGAFYNGSANLRCDTRNVIPADTQDVGLGVRCCAD